MATAVQTEYCDNLVAQAAYGHHTTTFSGPYYNAEVMLFINNPTLDKTTTLADLTAPSYSGYADDTPTWGTPNRDNNGNIGVDSDLMTFQMGNDSVPTTVNGYGILDTGGTHLLQAAYFDTPVDLVDELDFCAFVARVQFNNPQPGTQFIAD